MALRCFLPIVFGLICCCTACSPEPVDAGDAECTVLFYLAGRDNGLWEEVSEKIDAIAAGWDEYNGNLLILQDDETVDCPRLLQLNRKRDKKELSLICEYPGWEASSSVLMKQVFKDVREDFPSERYGLVLFSHASGWLPEQTLSAPRSLVPGEEGEISLSDFASALPEGMFRFIVFETCFMSGIEVMCELQGKTDFVVASSAEICSPGFTPVYSTVLKYLYQPEPDLVSYAAGYYAYWEKYNPASATISVIDMDKIPSLVESIAEMLETCRVTLIPQPPPLTVQRFDKLSSYSLFYDLSDYMQSLLPSQEADRIEKAIEDCVVYRASTPYLYNGITVDKHCGLTTYILQVGLPYLNECYTQTVYWQWLHGL